MTKPEAERIVRHLCHQWAGERGLRGTAEEHPSFSDFKSYLLERYPQALTFRSRASAAFDAELWFDQELKQTWRR